MMVLNSGSARRVAQVATVLLLGVAVVACTTSGRAVPVQETAPTVSYDYTDDEGLIDATLQAEAYCRQFNSWPVTADMHLGARGSNTVTFVCNQERTVTGARAQTPPLPANPTVSYTYRDERELIDATTQAQRYCADFGAYARSTTVTHRAGVGRTVVFECVRG